MLYLVYSVLYIQQYVGQTVLTCGRITLFCQSLFVFLAFDGASFESHVYYCNNTYLQYKMCSALPPEEEKKSELPSTSIGF